MDRQRAFDKIIDRLKRQDAHSTNGSLRMYRGFHGNRCPVGHLINDADYHDDMEGHGIRNLLEAFPHLKERLKIESDLDVDFLEALQYMHDFYWPAQWKAIFKQIARKFNLHV